MSPSRSHDVSVMSAGESLLRGEGGDAMPTSPFEMQITKDALQRRLDSGEITREDIEILQRSYRWMTITSVVGVATGVPVFILLGRRRPPVSFFHRFGAAAATSSVMSFLGFAAGGVAAAMEVDKRMPDSKNKIKVFQQIAIESKRAIVEHHRAQTAAANGHAPADARAAPGPNGGLRRFTRDDDSESDGSDSASAPSSSSPASPAPAEGSEGSASISTAVNDATASTWERLRTTRPAKPAPMSADEELRRQQAEFDAMLERERMGGDNLDKWR